MLADAKDAATDVRCGADAVWTASVDGVLRCYDLRQSRCVSDAVAGGAAVTSCALAHDSGPQAALAASLDGAVRLVDRGSGAVLGLYRGHSARTLRAEAALSAADEWVAAGSEDGRLVVWDLTGEKRIEASAADHRNGAVSSVDWHPQRNAVLSASSVSGTICLHAVS